MTRKWIVCVALIIGGVACSRDAQTPTSATTTTATPPILFSGTLQPRATRFYSYTLTTAGPVSALLASVERNGIPMANALEIGLGSPAGTGCAATVSANVSASLVPQIQQDAAIGTYCVSIRDVDGLPAPMTFTIRVIHP
jgi:hypothetical protein